MEVAPRKVHDAFNLQAEYDRANYKNYKSTFIEETCQYLDVQMKRKCGYFMTSVIIITKVKCSKYLTSSSNCKINLYWNVFRVLETSHTRYVKTSFILTLPLQLLYNFIYLQCMRVGWYSTTRNHTPVVHSWKLFQVIIY